MSAYVVGNITVLNAEKWAEYRSAVPATLGPFGGELVFRGSQAAILSGAQDHPDTVVIRFPDTESVNRWFASAEYQALIPTREQGARMDLVCYEAE